MIGTITTKQEQLLNGYFSIGSGLETILIMGSCRAVPYLNYLNDWNNQNGNRFTINFIDPFNWNWDLNDNRTDYNEVLTAIEANVSLLKMLSSTDIFIHEYYSNAGMFNCNKSAEKNIYQFGMKPKMDITLPNFNDVFILTRDIVSFDIDIRKKAIADYNVIGRLSERTLIDIDKVRDANLEKFYDICSKTDFPEFAQEFEKNYKKFRYFWTFNHIAKGFTLSIFITLNNKFLKLNITDEFAGFIFTQDMYANNYTYLCEYDKYYNWNEEIKPLKDSL